ncbi:MAG: hypothetical protein M0036_04815 [Desulfobacteraceae bacterium]|nr:hypothetical protein [Desulfobacteraceae bacterium]
MLAMIEIPEYLDKMYAHYKQLSKAIYDPIKSIGEERKVPKGSNLLAITDEPAFVYIADGFFKLFITGEPRNATVEAAEACMVRVINQNNFAEMIKSNPNFAISVSRTLSKRFSDVNKRLSGKSL